MKRPADRDCGFHCVCSKLEKALEKKLYLRRTRDCPLRKIRWTLAFEQSTEDNTGTRNFRQNRLKTLFPTGALISPRCTQIAGPMRTSSVEKMWVGLEKMRSSVGKKWKTEEEKNNTCGPGADGRAPIPRTRFNYHGWRVRVRKTTARRTRTPPWRHPSSRRRSSCQGSDPFGLSCSFSLYWE